MSLSKPTARRFNSRLRERRAFTLIELMIVLVLCGSFVGALYETILVALRAAHNADDRENVRQQLSNALDRIVREGGLASNVDQAQDQRFQFDADLDGDGSNENNINYVIQSGDLVRTQGGSTVTLIQDLTSIDFDYTDLSNAAMATPVAAGLRDNIRVVSVLVTAARNNETITLTTAVFLRNE